MSFLHFQKETKWTDWTIQQFWAWFLSRQESFFSSIIHEEENIPLVLDTMLEYVQKYHSGIFGLIGFYSESMLEFVFTSDGEIKNFVFIEELIAEAPDLKNWRFTFLKPKISHFDPAVHSKKWVFSKDKLYFHSEEDVHYPDEIDIILIHEDYLLEEDYQTFMNGSLLYLDNCLGELDFATKIDYIDLKRKEEVPKEVELIPISKLSDYILWREMEFQQKYEAHDTPLPVGEESNLLEAESEAFPLFAIIRTCWQDWRWKPYYCWATKLIFKYKGQENGLPTQDELLEIQEAESLLLAQLSSLSFCHIGRSTHRQESTLYLYTNEYKQISKQIYSFLKQTPFVHLEAAYHIYRDKYWRNVEQYF